MSDTDVQAAIRDAIERSIGREVHGTTRAVDAVLAVLPTLGYKRDTVDGMLHDADELDAIYSKAIEDAIAAIVAEPGAYKSNALMALRRIGDDRIDHMDVEPG